MPNRPRPLNQIQFRAAGLLPHLEERAGPGTTISSVAKRDLARYYFLLKEVPAMKLSRETLIEKLDRLEREPWDPPRVLPYLFSLLNNDPLRAASTMDALERAALLPEGDVDARLRKVGLIR